MNYYYPDIYQKSIYTINYSNLKERGIKYLLFDLDNTIVPYTNPYPSKKLKDFFKMLEEDFKIIIFSNSPKRKLEKFKSGLKVDCSYNSNKPFTKKLLKIIKMYNMDLSEVILIGDQLMTDIKCGNKAGITTALVNPISNTDSIFTKMNRKIEKKIINKMTKKGMFKIGIYYE